MNQFETRLQTHFKIALTALMVLSPSFSWASIPAQYFPAYSFKASHNETIPVGQSVISLNKSGRAPASINRAAVMIAAPSKIFYGEDGKALSPDLIATFNQFRAQERPIDMSQIIPMDMQPSDNSSQVFSQVADRSLNSFWNSPSVRESSLGRTATEVEKKMKKEVVIGGDDINSTQHKFNFNVQAFQALAQVQYSGFTNAALKFKATESKVAFEVFEKFAGNKDLVLSHSVSPADRVSELSMRWTF